MKKILVLMSIISTFALAGCAGPSLWGCLFTDITIPEPVRGSMNEVGSKVGRAESVNILGLVATGDSSIVAAAKNGGITKIKTADRQVNSILSIYTRITTVVTGE